MEVRFERKKKSPLKWIKKIHISWKTLLAGLMVCVLAGGFLWNYGKQTTVLAGYKLDTVIVDGQSKYVFNVVEVVPKKNLATLGLFIEGQEGQTISMTKLKDYVKNKSYGDMWQAENFLYWPGKSGGTGNEPFSIVENGNEKKVVNNEIFKLYMLGIGTYDKNKSIYDNYVANKSILEEFNEQFVINYQIVTLSELDQMDLSKINYIHIGGATQISDYPNFYSAVGLSGAADWNIQFSDDCSWDTALQLYRRALNEPRMSISISAYEMIGTTGGDRHRSNVFKLYQMLYYFDDPSVMEETFKGGALTNDKCYIDPDNGNIYTSDNVGVWVEHPDWDESFLNYLSLDGVPHGGVLQYRDKNDYIPEKFDNILIYSNGGGASGYFDHVASTETVNIILNFTDNKPSGDVTEEPEEKDGSIKVLEIEPCNSYWLSDSANLSKLALAAGVDEDDISVTYVTPNRLNGMTVDLVDEYDMIVVGNEVSLLNDLEPADPYRHNGYYAYAATTQTLVNGLLKDDYTTADDFNTNIKLKTQNASLKTGSVYLENSTSPLWNLGIREQWGNDSKKYILKNVGLSLELQTLNVPESVSRARFSGNDLTRYMQKQLAEFVKSGQPVIIADDLYTQTVKRIRDFQLYDMWDKTLDPGSEPSSEHAVQDSRIYFALNGMEDERDYYDEKNPPNLTYIETLIKKSVVENATGKVGGLSLEQDLKPGIVVKDTGTVKNEEGENVPTITKKDNDEFSLNGLAKSNFLSFQYEIALPRGGALNDCVMKVIIDRNGDGIFDENKKKTGKEESKKEDLNQNDAVLKEDKVFTVDFSALAAEDYVYDAGAGTIGGVFTSPEPVNSGEEFCQFRVIVSNKNESNRLRGSWTGYMRPELETRPVKILQITPYSKEQGAKPLSENDQFTSLIDSLGTEMEYTFDFTESGYQVMSEDDFSMACADGSITPETLKEYDLIIMGTDYNSDDVNDSIDIDEAAAKVLIEYTNVLKRPIIFTNDSLSYVNSKNYVAPEETNYTWQILTVEEGGKLAKEGKLTEKGGEYRREVIDETVYNGWKEKNEQAQKNGNYGEGTAYLDPIGLEEELVKAGSYNVIKRPISGGDDELYLGYSWWLFGTHYSREYYPGLNLKDLQNILGTDKIKDTWFFATFYRTQLGLMTENELRNLYQSDPSNENSIKTVVYNKKTYNYKDIHSAIETTYRIDSSQIENIGDPIIIAGDPYYKFLYDNKEYLAVQTMEDTWKKFGYVWKKKVPTDSGGDKEIPPEYSLIDVAGTAASMYPAKNSWNYFMTQSLRGVVGMDRFGITTDIKPEDKRDSGSSRRWAEIKELQGFTNAMLLEYAYIPEKDSPWASLVNTASPYANSLLALGTAPRTDAVELMNDGQIAHYPFELVDENEPKLAVAENHAPFYQLDLDRELETGKIDDVTVWYTFTGSGDVKMQQQSKYFDITRKDAGNNYYLYSKGKTYYTGFSLNDRLAENKEPLIPDQEMKLFINTIYAALSGTAVKTDNIYETVVNDNSASGSTITSITTSDLPLQPGQNHQYVCYYEEDTERLEIYFRVQKKSVNTGEMVPVTIKIKTGTDPGYVKILDDTYMISEGISLNAFPVAPAPNSDTDSGEIPAQELWYKLTLTFGDGGYLREYLDGALMLIATVDGVPGAVIAEDAPVRSDAIHSEIRLVMRTLFNLD